VAAVLDHHGLAMELADVRQRLGQDFGLVARGDVGDVVHGRGVRIPQIVPQAWAGPGKALPEAGCQPYTWRMNEVSFGKSAAARRHYLDVLRGLAAVLVLVSHADHSRQLDLGLSTTEKGFVGALGVYIFFILSGYLIWTSAQGVRQPGGLGTYTVHRVTRLVPLYLVNLLFVILLLPLLPSAFHPAISAEAV